MQDILLTTAQIAAGFAGFASVVVIFRHRNALYTDEETRVTFQSMLLGSLFVVFFSLLPLVLGRLLDSPEDGFYYSAACLLVYIVGTFIWGMFLSGGIRAGSVTSAKDGTSAVPFFIAALTIAASQAAGLLEILPTGPLYLLGIFTLLTISGYAFYALISFSKPGDR